MNPIDLMWTEKYRPKSVDDMVGDFKDMIKNYMKNPNSMKHLLLFSTSPGTGKTTLAKALMHDLGITKEDVLELNSSDERKIEVIRDKIKTFVMTKSSVNGKRRLIILDEADGLLSASQDALRNMMETYSSNALFILTCNNVDKIIKPLQDRCTMIPFSKPNKKDIQAYLESICEKEELQYSSEGIIELVELNYPSIRNCVGTLQDLKTQDKQVTKETVKPFNETFNMLWKKIKEERDHTFVSEYILKHNIDSRELNLYFWNKAVLEGNIKMIQLTCRNERDMALGSKTNVIFISSLIEMVK